MRKRGYILAVVAVAAAAIGLTGILEGGSACPPDTTSARQSLGLMTTGSIVNLPAGLQPVTHGGTCSKIRKAIKDDYSIQGGNADWSPTYYQTADRYYAILFSTEVPPPDVGAFGPDVLIELDVSFNILKISFN